MAVEETDQVRTGGHVCDTGKTGLAAWVACLRYLLVGTTPASNPFINTFL